MPAVFVVIGSSAMATVTDNVNVGGMPAVVEAAVAAEVRVNSHFRYHGRLTVFGRSPFETGRHLI